MFSRKRLEPKNPRIPSTIEIENASKTNDLEKIAPTETMVVVEVILQVLMVHRLQVTERIHHDHLNVIEDPGATLEMSIYVQIEIYAKELIILVQDQPHHQSKDVMVPLIIIRRYKAHPMLKEEGAAQKLQS